MKILPSLPVKLPSTRVWRFILIVVLATTAGMIFAWRAPGLSRYAQDSLMRARGTLAVPEDIVIVAIDEESISQLGQFPWKRTFTAQVLNTISPVQPKAIAVDVLYVEPTEREDDQILADAVKKAGNVVLAEQLIEVREQPPEPERSAWLTSLPEIKNAGAGTGHVNVLTEQDGTARELMLRLADDEGFSQWALAVETIRVGDRIEKELIETDRFVQIGNRRLPFIEAEKYSPLKLNDTDSRLSVIQPLRMTIV
jgi:CHASE2 domain-containing sensor protein